MLQRQTRALRKIQPLEKFTLQQLPMCLVWFHSQWDCINIILYSYRIKDVNLCCAIYGVSTKWIFFPWEIKIRRNIMSSVSYRFQWVTYKTKLNWINHEHLKKYLMYHVFLYFFHKYAVKIFNFTSFLRYVFKTTGSEIQYNWKVHILWSLESKIGKGLCVSI